MGSGRKPLKPFLSDELEAVVARAYAAFDLPIPPATGVCEGCCMDAEIEADFLNHQARDLPLPYIQDWYFAAYTDRTGFPHVGWLLPRIMELVARGEEVASVGEEVVFQRLTLTGYPDKWAPRRVEVVTDFAEALMRQRVRGDGAEVDVALCMFGIAGVDIRPLLDLLWALDDDDLARALWGDLWPYQLRDGMGMSAFWEGPQRDVAWAWYTAPALKERMLAYAAASPQPPHMEAAFRIAAAIEAAADG